MYAVVKTGGKQYRVEENQVLEVELLGDIGDSISLTPLMLVDGKTVLAKPSELESVNVNAEIVNRGKSKKITGFTYKNKSNQRRRWGHRQNITKSNHINIKELIMSKTKGGGSTQMAEIPTPRGSELKLTTEPQYQPAPSSFAREERSSTRVKMCAEVEMIRYSQPLMVALNSVAGVEENS